MSRSRLFFGLLALALILSLGWAFSGNQMPPADFTFVNNSEIKGVDPAKVNGSPEGNIVRALFEGLTRWHPETLEPIPGIAERWEISDDGLVYTFHLREDAKWSDGSLVTAGDMVYSLRRFLGPRTIAEYAYLGWCIKNARRYSLASSSLKVGDLVEVEANLPVDAINTLRGELVHGKLVEIEELGNDEKAFVVEHDGKQTRYLAADDADAIKQEPPADSRWCRQVLLDFREVGIEEIDSRTLRITLESPTAYFLKLVGYYPFAPVQQRCVEKYGSPGWTKQENIVSNGAFTLGFRRIRDRIRLIKSDTYWNRENVRLNIVDALAIEARTTAVNLYMTDEVDWIISVPTPSLKVMLKADPPRNDLKPAPFLGVYYYMLNTTRKPLDDLRVRRALSLALDREEITSILLAAGEVPALSLVPPGITGYQAQETEVHDTQAKNVARAQELLAEAGFPKGQGFPRLDILYNTDEAHQSIAELIRKQWQRELGISIKTRSEEWAACQSSQQQMRYNVARRAWIGDYTDPNTFLDMFVTGGDQNNTGWGNPDYDRLIREAALETDPQKRMRLFEEAERLLMEELPIVPIYFYVSKNMVKPYVRGFYNNLQDVHPLSNIWIDRESKSNEFTNPGIGKPANNKLELAKEQP
ncbi:peptide ABC transporter substrate-binding protein [Adhaeretor mobilis]|uniref:Oligopeptide-binding protein OppA n=1 Tax=Adhaeretor mobilis TaxID=1930276 RepID=A0A517MSM4_9BACT|nr:peptide ABC transporter substrate-binding protein [Adhaeretor mobilis]QDS97883.1 Oligopeptide-binding protein OppA precursor [Adhaeretor mobilis]